MDLFLIISIIFFIIAHIFLLIQGSVNYNFYIFKDRKIIVEKTLFEQFSYEVYSSINSPLYINNEIKDKCDQSYQSPIYFNLNLDTFFDCRGIFNKELNFCKDKIVNNNTDCNSQEGYISYNDLNNLLDYDPRITYCKYYSKFKQKINKLFSESICQNNNNYKFDYEQLLNNSVKERDAEGRLNPCPNNFKKCGILDTKRNILCINSNSMCPNNNIEISNSSAGTTIIINETHYLKFTNDDSRDIVKSIILSENAPLSHEWDLMVRETYEELDDTDIQKRRIITSEDFKLLNMEEDNTYQLLNVNDLNLKVETVKNNNYFIGGEDFKYNKDQTLNIYTRNYIGFKDLEELNKFKKRFNNNNSTDNPLYKICTPRHNPLITIIIPIVFIFISIAYLVLKIIKIFQDSLFKILFYVFSILIILFCILELIIIFVHFVRYPNIYIDMDDRMEKVLDLYNKRTFMSQIFRIISLFFNVISLVFAILYYFKNIRTTL